MQEELVRNNRVKVKGRVITDLTFSHEVFGEMFLKFKMETPRFGEAKDEMKVIISERIGDIDIYNLKDKCISIEGEFRSYNNWETGKSKLDLYVFVKEIQLISEEEVFPGDCNEIFLDGYICKPPIYRKTPLGREICDLMIAVNRPYGKCDYIPCICWGRNARYAGSMEMGHRLKIEGRIQSRVYHKKIGDATYSEERVAYEISINKLEDGDKELF